MFFIGRENNSAILISRENGHEFPFINFNLTNTGTPLDTTITDAYTNRNVFLSRKATIFCC